jgi:hypothetical protein
MYSSSDYNTLGNPKNKIGTKKRGSEMTTNRAVSPESKSLIKS